ncbi:uncharacterized protein BDR25DRAFT_317571 [Lindgomyces ingoldianus]|uniref:Uncharacterized protein n=1 Tax=Lindgomyces ingoldianus TaxID=673940 RepID=A0ACB6QKC6_9PLEO|nr:uncharacterized protein BDR25DRAFT_317571 [Lindgomyces ingoldianus]KAF2466567.1 hypothetical protein BDR25DRAFT_317571 [Lindgomyces ingoldianus]
MDQHNTQPATSVWSLAQMLSDIDLTKYHHTLIGDQTLHVTEEQLGHLGFKLGHQRRLQRQIASFKGYPLLKPLPATAATNLPLTLLLELASQSEEPKPMNADAVHYETNQCWHVTGQFVS